MRTRSIWRWCAGLQPRFRGERPPTMKIAVFCPNLIGDTVMATPTFRALRQGFPGATIVGVIKPRLVPTLLGSPWFDDWIFFDKRSRIHDQRSWGVFHSLRRGRFDLAVLLPNSFRPALLAWMAGIPRRIGYVRYGRGPLLTDRLYHTRDKTGSLVPAPIVGNVSAAGPAPWLPGRLDPDRARDYAGRPRRGPRTLSPASA